MSKQFQNSQRYQEFAAEIVALGIKKGATDVEVSVGSCKGFSVTSRAGAVETVEHDQASKINITLMIGKRQGSVSTNDLNLDSVERVIEAGLQIAKYTEEDEFLTMPDESELAFGVDEPQLCFPWDVSIGDAIKKTIKCESLALSYDKRIRQSQGVTLSSHVNQSVFANSMGFVGNVNSTSHDISCCLVAKSENEMVRCYDYTLARDAADLLTLEEVAKRAAISTVEKIGARKIKTQKSPVIFGNRCSSILFRSLVRAISGRNIYNKTSFLLDKVGEKIMPANLNISEDPFKEKGLGSASFDAEGVKTRAKKLIGDGQLLTYIMGTYSANQLGMKTTGNAGGTTNVIVEPTFAGDALALAKEMGQGLLVTKVMGSGVNIVNGNFSVGVSGLWIENGEVQFPVHEVTVAGNLLEMFSGIAAVGDDINRNQSMSVGAVLVNEVTIAGS